MKKRIIRRLSALAGAAGLCLACAAPVFAEETQWEYLEQIRFGPQGNSAAGHVQTVLSGPDVGEDGFVTLTKGETYSFTCDMTFQVPRSTMQYSSWGIVARTDLLDQERVYEGREGQQDAVHEEFLVLGTDGKKVTVARPVPASKGSLRVTFTDLALNRNARIEAGEDPTEIWPDLTGSAEMELHCTIEAVATLPLPQVERADGEWQFETRKAAQEYIDAVWQALAARGWRVGELLSLRPAKHIFTHVEWHMTGYYVELDALPDGLTLVSPAALRADYALPSAFRPFLSVIEEEA